MLLYVHTTSFSTTRSLIEQEHSVPKRCQIFIVLNCVRFDVIQLRLDCTTLRLRSHHHDLFSVLFFEKLGNLNNHSLPHRCQWSVLLSVRVVHRVFPNLLDVLACSIRRQLFLHFCDQLLVLRVEVPDILPQRTLLRRVDL